jgi:hypothetical protein
MLFSTVSGDTTTNHVVLSSYTKQIAMVPVLVS